MNGTYATSGVKPVDFHGNMGRAVAERTILRKKADGEWETWGDVSERVALGNALIEPRKDRIDDERRILEYHLKKGNILLSGRQLQHGDENQPLSKQEKFTNCSTSITSFMLFTLLLNGSGVGRSYDPDLIVVNWSRAPRLINTFRPSHPDYEKYATQVEGVENLGDYENGKHGEVGIIERGNDVWKRLRDGEKLPKVLVHRVEDSREGWGLAFQIWETMTFHGIYEDNILVLDYTGVRPEGSPIRGMQNRPSSGPVPMMKALDTAYEIAKRDDWGDWKKTMHIDHELAACVVVGGVRRSARMATMHWKYDEVFDFIDIKRPLEYRGKSVDEIIAMRKRGEQYETFLWSANNSVVLDSDFWHLVGLERDHPEYNSRYAKHARKVLRRIVEASYGDGTGEPGAINGHKLVRNRTGLDRFGDLDEVFGSDHFDCSIAEKYIDELVTKAVEHRNDMIVNPCVTKDTVIATSKGDKTVEELIGVRFYASVGGRSRYCRKGFFHTGKKEVFLVKTVGERKLKATGNHSIIRIVDDGGKGQKVWTTVNDLDKGMRVLIEISGVRVEDEVSSVESVGEEDVYDCNIEGHTYVSNGFVSHNCGEIALHVLGGFCVIADVVPLHADTLDEAEDAFRTAARALVRLNLLDSVYRNEVRRTNRIGVGFTGIHEFYWDKFRITFREVIDPDEEGYLKLKKEGYSVDGMMRHPDPSIRAMAFWMTMNRFGRAAVDEADRYSDELGLVRPHTVTTVKPAGTTSKLMGLSEGAHLPSMAYYLRWVQFKEDSPLVEEYVRKGLPVKKLVSYPGTVVVGFPTAPKIVELGIGDRLITADEVTMEENFRWVSLIEKYYITGVDPDTLEPLKVDRGNQVSFTAKYRYEELDIETFFDIYRKHMPNVKAISIMPVTDNSAYEYVPEQPISKEEYDRIVANIKNEDVEEDIGLEHISCEGGACPVDFNGEMK